jgi:DNA invertase Pin-like site-specific DNA recombinase
MDRLARNLDDLRRLVQKLTKRGVRIEFVKECLTFTGEDSPMANLMLSVMGAFAEFERALIRERQREGIALAKQRGAYRGRKKALSPEQAPNCGSVRGRRTKGEAGPRLRHQPGNPVPVPARKTEHAASFHPVRRRARKPAGDAGHQGRPDPTLHVQRYRPVGHPAAARACEPPGLRRAALLPAIPWHHPWASISRRSRPC